MKNADKSSFGLKKQRILEQLAAPPDQYQDLSPKGTIDDEIVDLVKLINAQPGLITTSSCAGRISVFLEGNRHLNVNDLGENALDAPEKNLHASEGGKGGGGKWLFVSHAIVTSPHQDDYAATTWADAFGMKSNDGSVFERLVHFKFEPMILHILTCTMQDAQKVLSAALQAGFRESGAINVAKPKDTTPCPMVAVRSMGLALDSVVGSAPPEGNGAVSMVSEDYMCVLVRRANERFEANKARIHRFRTLLAKFFVDDHRSVNHPVADSKKPNWEDSDARRLRMREAGLARQAKLRYIKGGDEDDLHDLLQEKVFE